MGKILKVKNIELMVRRINDALEYTDEVIYNIEELLEMGELYTSLIELEDEIIELIANNKLLSWHNIYCERIGYDEILFYKLTPRKEEMYEEESSNIITKVLDKLFKLYEE